MTENPPVNENKYSTRKYISAWIRDDEYSLETTHVCFKIDNVIIRLF
jgi:hypothetical protein